ncbi:cell adhesion molecule CEACAM6 isoform X1 [Genypterus blacodes]|uniref:cell adhesion molecule CEACAM6 isoform X1 n=1 Tax=Genypterus blacodes TaxID=154954 RepID=UPI003F75B13A
MGKEAAQIWLLLTLSLKGILAGDWSVHLPAHPICAVIGSSVVISCSYDYPQSSNETRREGQATAESTAGVQGAGEEEQQYKVLSEMWCLEESRCITPSYVFHSAGIFPDPSFHNRVEYLGKPGTKNCSLRISELREVDSGTYVFYLITSHPTQKMPEQRGIQLLVAGSSSSVSVLASPSSDITEGTALRFTCCSPAANPNSHFRWYKNNVTPRHAGQVWSMSDIASEASGSYYCQVQTAEKVQNSTVLTVDVQYAPRNTCVSGSPTGEQPVKLPVTLTCSSDANPPVQTYTWYHGSVCPSTAGISFHQGREVLATPTGTGQTLSIDEYGPHCCIASNKHGSQMSTVTLSDSSGEKTLVIGLIIAALVVVALMALAAFIMKRRKRSSRHHTYALTETQPTSP